MSKESAPFENLCAQCGTSTAGGAAQCWRCGATIAAGDSQPSRLASTKTLTLTDVENNPYAVGLSGQSPQTRSTFGINSLMLTITLIAICLAATLLSLWLGVALAVIVTPAYLRTAFAARRRRSYGQPWTMEEKLLVFAGSMGVVLAISVSSVIAFYATCWAGFFGGAAASEAAGVKGYDPIGYGLFTGIALGVVAGLVVGVFTIRWLWRFERKKPVD